MLLYSLAGCGLLCVCACASRSDACARGSVGVGGACSLSTIDARLPLLRHLCARLDQVLPGATRTPSLLSFLFALFFSRFFFFSFFTVSHLPASLPPVCLRCVRAADLAARARRRGPGRRWGQRDRAAGAACACARVCYLFRIALCPLPCSPARGPFPVCSWIVF